VILRDFYCSLFTDHYSLRPLAGRPDEEGIATAQSASAPPSQVIQQEPLQGCCEEGNIHQGRVLGDGEGGEPGNEKKIVHVVLKGAIEW